MENNKKQSPWMTTMIKKHGSREAVREVQKKIGAIGGSRSSTGGFASMSFEQVSAAGAKGGRISRRGKAKANE